MTTPRIPAMLLVAMAGFQAALAAGAPWGPASYGGAHAGRLPAGLRVASGAASLAYLAGAGTLFLRDPHSTQARWAARACVAVGALGVPTNALSPSPPERWWSLWSLALAATSWSTARH